MKCRAALALALGLALLSAVGCRPAGTARTVKITGTVTYNGKPMKGVRVTFTPEHGRPGTGSTDASGKFTPSTSRRNDGVVPGKHIVTMAPAKSAPAPTGKEGEEAVAQWPFPRRYGSSETSGFAIEVKKGGQKDFKFDMNDEPAPAPPPAPDTTN